MAETTKLKMYRITLKCLGVPADEGTRAAKDIETDLGARAWHVDVHCWWDGSHLFLTAWNDFDETGLALREEFSEMISAHVHSAIDAEIETVEVLSMQ